MLYSELYKDMGIFTRLNEKKKLPVDVSASELDTMFLEKHGQTECYYSSPDMGLMEIIYLYYPQWEKLADTLAITAGKTVTVNTNNTGKNSTNISAFDDDVLSPDSSTDITSTSTSTVKTTDSKDYKNLIAFATKTVYNVIDKDVSYVILNRLI